MAADDGATHRQMRLRQRRRRSVAGIEVADAAKPGECDCVRDPSGGVTLKDGTSELLLPLLMLWWRGGSEPSGDISLPPPWLWLLLLDEKGGDKVGCTISCCCCPPPP